ncbi:unnamed protein product [Sphagnum balticum]
MSWKPVYGLLMFGMTLANFVFGLKIHDCELSYKKPLLITAVASNLLTLAFFKYAYFAHDAADQMVKVLGLSLPPLTMQIILPLGISFFVFEFIHYVVEVYRGSQPVRSFIDFALFASFFPTQIAGPIKRYTDFIPQLSNPHKVTLSTVEQSAWLIVSGLVRKILFADYLAIVVHSAFEHPELLSSLDLWLATYAFAFQIYFDFSAYTDIARGSALLFGFSVPPNFNLPYLANSIADFWRRWHISLSTWLRDYLFIPLGGSRCSQLFNYRNLFITMVLGGIWHGAAGHFAVWGAYQGALLVFHKEFQRIAERFESLKVLRETIWFHYFSIALTFHAVCIGWVFFRADNMPEALAVIGKLLFLPSAGLSINPFALSLTSTTESTVFLMLPLMLATIFFGQAIVAYLSANKGKFVAPALLQGAALAVAICLLIVLSPDFAPKFIYFQF